MIEAWTKVRTYSCDSYTFNVYKWKNPDLQVLWMFLEIQVRIELQHVPKFLATDTGATSMLPTVRL